MLKDEIVELDQLGLDSITNMFRQGESTQTSIVFRHIASMEKCTTEKSLKYVEENIME